MLEPTPPPPPMHNPGLVATTMSAFSGISQSFKQDIVRKEGAHVPPLSNVHILSTRIPDISLFSSNWYISFVPISLYESFVTSFNASSSHLPS
jgi:hypothetical protein